MRRAALGFLVVPALALAHGGVGVPLLGPVGPGIGVIQDAVDGRAEISWTDLDPDDNANLKLMYTRDPQDPAGPVQFANGLPEDCDPGDAGRSVFTGVLDAGGGDAARPPQEVLDQAYCRRTDGGCTYEYDCYAWDVSAMPQGNYWVLGVLDDHWPDGGGGAVSFRLSKGLIRVVPPGANVQPALLFLQPDGVGDLTDTCYRVQWVDSDPDDNATLRLFIAPAFGEGAPVLVAEGLHTGDAVKALDVDLRGAPMRTDLAFIAELDDGVNPPWRVRSPGYVTRYVRLLADGGHAPHDGGCLGPAQAWPDGSAWPREDAGADAGGAHADGGVPARDAGSRLRDAGPGGEGGGKGCRPGNALSPTGDLPWVGLALALAAAGRRRR